MTNLTPKALTRRWRIARKRLYAYGGKELEVIEISAGDKKISSHLVVTKRKCLLGYESSKALGLLRIGSGV